PRHPLRPSLLFPYPTLFRSRSASGSVASACTTDVKSSAKCWTIFRSSSIAITSWPDATSSSAKAVPNRPRPMTSTAVSKGLANDGPFGWITIKGRSAPCRKPCRQRDNSNSANKHQHDQDPLTGLRSARGESSAQTHRTEGRQGFKRGDSNALVRHRSQGHDSGQHEQRSCGHDSHRYSYQRRSEERRVGKEWRTRPEPEP